MSAEEIAAGRVVVLQSDRFAATLGCPAVGCRLLATQITDSAARIHIMRR